MNMSCGIGDNELRSSGWSRTLYNKKYRFFSLVWHWFSRHKNKLQVSQVSL